MFRLYMIKLRKRSIFVNDSYFKMTVHLQYLKGMQSCKLQGMWKGVQFVNTRYMKGLPFSYKIGPVVFRYFASTENIY